MVQTSGSGTERLEDVSRHHTIVFVYPSDNHYYIALTEMAFEKTFREWIGMVPDCYILDTKSLDNDFEVFTSSDVLYLMHESDEKVEAQDELIVNGEMGNGANPFSSIENEEGEENAVDEINTRRVNCYLLRAVRFTVQ